MNTKTHYEDGYECLNELCECGGTIRYTSWNKNSVLGAIVLFRQCFCLQCGKEMKKLRETKIHTIDSKYGI